MRFLKRSWKSIVNEKGHRFPPPPINSYQRQVIWRAPLKERRANDWLEVGRDERRSGKLSIVRGAFIRCVFILERKISASHLGTEMYGRYMVAYVSWVSSTQLLQYETIMGNR